MAVLAELLDDGQGAALARLQLELATSSPPAAEPTAALCPTCGQLRPVPVATFRPVGEDLTCTADYQEG